MAESDQSTPLSWRKSTFSEAGNCVEVAHKGRSVLVRDSADPSSPISAYSIEDWQEFLTLIKCDVCRERSPS